VRAEFFAPHLNRQLKKALATIWNFKWLNLHPARDFKERTPYYTAERIAHLNNCANNFTSKKLCLRFDSE